MTIIMKGAEVAASIKAKLAEEISQLNFKPELAILRVGSRSDDLAYERGILKRFESLNLGVNVHELPENISQQDFDAEFSRINNNDNVHGILLFRPLPENLSGEFAVNNINPRKDIDCMSPINAAKVFAGNSDCFAPCTASAVIEMLGHYNFCLQGKNVVIVGRSMVIGRPLAMLMLAQNATVTICHTKTQNLPEICRSADILVAAAGKAGIITSEFVKEKSIVIDVGININSKGKLCGDVEYESVSQIVQAISPVPGGVGAVTTSVLAKNLVKAAKFLN